MPFVSLYTVRRYPAGWRLCCSKYAKYRMIIFYFVVIATKILKEILREIGMIARALDSISNIEFKEYDLTRG